MRVPLPDRFKFKSVILFTVVLVVVQQIEKTDATFSLLTAIYIALFALAFNLGGGLFYLAGAYVFFNGTLSALLGISYKCLLGEPGQSNLIDPNRTMAVYCVGMAGLVLAAGFSRRFIPQRGLLAGMAEGEAMKSAAIGCFIFGIVLQLATASTIQTSGLSSAIGQVNHFIQMAIILGTTYELTSSGGKRSSNWIVWSASLWLFVFGLIVFSKEGFFIPIVSWLIPAVVLGFNFSKKQLFFGAITLFVIFHYLVPFSQYGRLFRSEGGGANAAVAYQMLRHPENTRDLFLVQQERDQDAGGGANYFNEPQGLFDREQMLSVDDQLIVWSEQGNFRGITPTIQAFENLVPHFIWHSKPVVEVGNDYAREMGMLPEDDTTTGISFSPAGDGYHEAGFFGAGVVFPFVAFLFFVVGDTLCGDTRKSPWGLLLIALSTHVAPEGLISGAVYLLGYGSFAVVLTALLAKYVLPIVSNLLTGSERTRVRRTTDFRPIVRGARINTLLREPDATPPTRGQ